MLQREKHEEKMSKILFDLARHPVLSPLLGFKGGTACYFLYGLPRFSTDLDFTLTKELGGEEIYAPILEILKRHGQIKESYEKRWTFFFLLSYEKTSHNIKIEISKRGYPNDRFKLEQYLGIPLLVMEKPLMAAHKLVAITDRSKMMGRDLFDAHFFLKNEWPIDAATVEYRTDQKLPSYLRGLAEMLKKKPPKHILDGIGELIDEKQKVWTKAHLLEELLFFLELRAKSARFE
ncbi:MAG: nucleotidyl transferase AbiEii/AbiGii toxin family protein [Deltaproteobacteria bacterium]|nr:nucleotidyl transferase AbiEii/AbiGii toxin family protein [Deltaproteobacteria bacterium]